MSLLEPIVVRYTGGWADEGRLPLREFARSAEGLDDILGICAEFAITQRVVVPRPARSVRLITQAPRPECFEFIPVIEAVSQHPLVVNASSGLFGALLALVYAKLAQKPEEPKSLALVEKMMEGMGRDKERNHAMAMEFVNAIEKKRPAGARGVCPIGAGCDRMVLGHGTVSEITLTPGDRELIELGPEAEIETRTISVKISELDRITGGCRVSFDGEKKRCRGTILDPTVREDGNKYANALTQGKEIEVIVDISLVEGEIKKVMIKKPASD